MTAPPIPPLGKDVETGREARPDWELEQMKVTTDRMLAALKRAQKNGWITFEEHAAIRFRVEQHDELVEAIENAGNVEPWWSAETKKVVTQVRDGLRAALGIDVTR